MDTRTALGIVLVLGLGCNKSSPPAAAPTAAPPAITQVKPEKRVLKRVVEQPAMVQAFEEAVLYAKLPGFVRSLGADPAKAGRAVHDRGVDIGSRVTAGQVLAELAVPELEQELQQKAALVRQAAAEVEQSKKALAAAAAAVTAAKAHVAEAKAGLGRAQAVYDRWQSESRRSGRSVTGGVIDTQTRDEILNQLKAAEAGRGEATARIASAEAAVLKAVADQDKATADVTAVEAKREVAQADARRVAAVADYRIIKAPFDGVVTRRTAGTGDFVTADGKAGLFAVARIDPVRVVAHVPEADAGLVAEGQAVNVLMTGVDAVQGTVTRTAWSLEPGSRTLRTEIDLPNTDAKLRPGLFATLRITIEFGNEWTLPAAAITKFADEPMAYLAENGKAMRVPLQLGRGDGTHTQVKRYRKPGTTDWTAVTGNETFASPAVSLADGQTLP